MLPCRSTARPTLPRRHTQSSTTPPRQPPSRSSPTSMPMPPRTAPSSTSCATAPPRRTGNAPHVLRWRDTVSRWRSRTRIIWSLMTAPAATAGVSWVLRAGMQTLTPDLPGAQAAFEAKSNSSQPFAEVFGTDPWAELAVPLTPAEAKGECTRGVTRLTPMQISASRPSRSSSAPRTPWRPSSPSRRTCQSTLPRWRATSTCPTTSASVPSASRRSTLSGRRSTSTEGC